MSTAIPQAIKSTNEPWGEIVLTDGSVIRFRTVITGVFLMEGQSDPNGNPAYGVQTSLVLAAQPASERAN